KPLWPILGTGHREAEQQCQRTDERLDRDAKPTVQARRKARDIRQFDPYHQLVSCSIERSNRKCYEAVAQPCLLIDGLTMTDHSRMCNEIDRRAPPCEMNELRKDSLREPEASFLWLVFLL